MMQVRLEDCYNTEAIKPNISTSHEAYLSTMPMHELQRTKVLSCIKRHSEPISDMQIYDETKVPIYLIPARRNELIDEGLVQQFGFVEYKDRRRKGWK